jgi:Protein of unknown function (DUF2934)
MDMDREIEIARRAYDLWEDEGRPEGKALDHWLRAEATSAGRAGIPRMTAIAPPAKPARKRRAATTTKRKE